MIQRKKTIVAGVMKPGVRRPASGALLMRPASAALLTRRVSGARFVAIALLALLAALPSPAREFMTQQQALASAFPKGSSIERETIFLTKEELARASRASGVEIEGALVVRYVAKTGGRVVGFAYFDVHRVRTLPETVMVVVTPESAIGRIEILSFKEPMDYFPRERWIDQFDGKMLDDELSLNRAIRPISGATLTGRSITNAARKILAIHEVIEQRAMSDEQ